MPSGVRSLLRVPGSARWGEEEEGAVVCGVMVQPAQGLGGPEVNTNTFTSHSIIVDKRKKCLLEYNISTMAGRKVTTGMI